MIDFIFRIKSTNEGGIYFSDSYGLYQELLQKFSYIDTTNILLSMFLSIFVTMYIYNLLEEFKKNIQELKK